MKLNNIEVKGVIFDFDGTLVDSWKVWAKVDERFFKKRGLELPPNYGEIIGPMGLAKAAEYTIKEFNLDETPEEIINEWRTGVIEEYANDVKFKEGSLEFLHYLKDNNIPICLATANDKDVYMATLKHYGIEDIFDGCFEVNLHSSKEKPDIFLACAKFMNVNPSDTYVFEDMSTPLKVAKDAGFNTVAVFDEYSKFEKEKKELGDLYITSYKDLDKYIS